MFFSVTVDFFGLSLIQTSKQICEIIYFVENCGANSTQLWKSVVFFACGVTEKPLSLMSCIDNIDFEEWIHFKSVENTTRMFHKKWRHFHILDKSLPQNSHQKISPSKNIKKQSEVKINTFFNRQIFWVMMPYIAKIDKPKKRIPLKPPPIEGIGDVFQDIIKQTNISETQYFSKLNIMDGDLGDSLNLEIPRSQRKPRGLLERILGNMFMFLGVSLTIWNIAQAIFLHHVGNNTKRKDLREWSTLQALGIPLDQPVSKNNFTLMLPNIKKIHEESLIYYLLCTQVCCFCGFATVFKLPDPITLMILGDYCTSGAAVFQELQHYSLISPSGRPNNFFAKEFYLEIQKDVFSLIFTAFCHCNTSILFKIWSNQFRKIQVWQIFISQKKIPYLSGQSIPSSGWQSQI
ncbi:hypothetical protein VP01_1250g8 [Puccinia sorghi]|uniref:Uncharacterized protein n=1 Tax=Puccinia sorghi TaxID=27349 RepID=A0A0L6VPF1_9BASI|nr:hypothetical protein VP01_1250g8 [Puccinia sorghi]